MAENSAQIPASVADSPLAAEMARVFAAPAFARSKANRALLQYLVDECQAGRGEKVSEYTIAMDLLGRGAEFDPAHDPLVRVRMQRLRKALVTHYEENPPAQDMLTLPRGSYIPALVPAPEPAADLTPAPTHRPEAAPAGAAQAPIWDATASGTGPDPQSRRFSPRLILGGVFVALLTVALVVLSWRPTPQSLPPGLETQYPIVSVQPFTNATGAAQYDLYEAGFQRQLASDLQRFGRARLRVPPAPMAQEAGDADFVITGDILDLSQGIDLLIELKDGATQRVILSKHITTQDASGEYVAALRDISREISGQLAGQGGVLSTHALQEITPNLGLPASSGLSAFRCVVLTDAFLATLSAEAYGAAHGCFLPHRLDIMSDPVVATAWGTLQMHGVEDFRFMNLEDVPPEKRFKPEPVFDYARELVSRFPASDGAHVLLGALHNARGETQEAIQALTLATQINPAEPTTQAVLAFALMADDQLMEASAHAQEAIRVSADPAPFMFVPVLIDALAREDAILVEFGRTGLKGLSGPSEDALRLAAAGFLGDRAEIDMLLPKMDGVDDTLAQIGFFVRGEAGRSAILAPLRALGLDPEFPPATN